jgi:hypothetical protein
MEIWPPVTDDLGVLPPSALGARDRVIGTCSQYARNVDASGVPQARTQGTQGVAMEPAVYLGVDVGKTAHYALAVDASGKPIYQSGVPNDEAALHKLVDWAREHAATVVVDQPGGTAALLLKLCWQNEVRVGYLHGLAMARAREFYGGESKTDAKDGIRARRCRSCASWWSGLARAEQRRAGSAEAVVRLRRRSARRCQLRDQPPSGSAGSALASSRASVRRAPR